MRKECTTRISRVRHDTQVVFFKKKFTTTKIQSYWARAITMHHAQTTTTVFYTNKCNAI